MPVSFDSPLWACHSQWMTMRSLATLLFPLTLTFACPGGWAASFRFSLLSEPLTLDPQATSISSGNFLFQNLYRGLYRYQSQRGLILEGAKRCERSKLKLICSLNTQHRWSNGDAITAQHYVTAFRRLIDPEKRSPQSELIFTLKNARQIWAGALKIESLGVSATNPTTLTFEFAEEDFEFEYKLISSSLAPWPPTGLLERSNSSAMAFSGPYRIDEWKPGHFVHLLTNPFYGLPANSERPALEALFLDDDSTALSLYEAGKIDFLRRLTSNEIPRFRNKPDFKQFPIARFDYIGFGPRLKAHPKLRQALIESAEFKQFSALFSGDTPPGCPSLPSRYMDRQYCQSFTPIHARKLLAQDLAQPDRLQFYFSKMGGDDIARAAEWFQGQWKKNLGLNIELNAAEQTGYLHLLHAKPPDIFRKGVSLDRPTCLAAVELFAKESPENLVHVDSKEFEQYLARLRQPLTVEQRKVACRKAVQALMDQQLMVPLGQMNFTVLASLKFRDWTLNELNQLDLTDLAEVRP